MYDELLAGKASRLRASTVLIGYPDKPQHVYLCKDVDKFLDKHRNEYLDLDLASPEAKVPLADLKQVIVDWACKKRKDPKWHHKEDKIYVDLAVGVYAAESHHLWNTRPEQGGGRGMRRKNANSALGSVKRRSPGRDSMFEPEADLDRSILGSNLTTAIDVDDDVDMELNDLPNTPIEPLVLKPKSTPLVALANPTYNKIPAGMDINNLAEVQAAFFRLQHENKQKEKVIGRLNETSLQQRQAAARAEADRDQLEADCAALGFALAQTLKLRKGSQAAVVSVMAKQASLPQDVTQRLMHNIAFTNRWFPGARIVDRQ